MRKMVILAAFAVIAAGCAKSDGEWNSEPVIPVTLAGIEAVNIDNSGEFPVQTGERVKKDAYMVGVRWVTDNTPTENDKFISGPIREGHATYGTIADRYSKAVVCLTQFNEKIAPGSYVSKFFKEIDRDYLPSDVDEGFVLLVAPDPGPHSFRVEYYLGTELKFSYDTPTIEFF